MASPLANIPIYTNTGHTLTPLEQAFISAFIVCKNVSQAVREAGYKCKRPDKYVDISKNSGKKEGEKYEYVNGYI